MKCVLSSAPVALALLAATAAAHIIDHQLLDAAHSVILADADGRPGHFVLYLVTNPTGQTLVTLDSDPRGVIASTPTLEVLPGSAVYLHFFGDYGFYAGSIKYLYDLAGNKPVLKIPYSRIALTASGAIDGKLRFAATYAEHTQEDSHDLHATIVIEPRQAALPSYQIVAKESYQPQTSAPELHGPGGESVRVENTPIGQAHRPAAIAIGSGTSEHRFPVPIPTLEFYRRTLPQKQPPGEIESDIGPFAQHSDRIWFASTFYDGEGTSGVGAIGSFDISSRHYEMRYLPEIAPWSGSAILLDADDLWIGLKRRPEGADLGAGLLRYNIPTGAVRTYAIPDVIFTLDRAGDALYCGTSHGLYMLRADQLTQLRFEPDATGKLTMIPRPIAK